MKNRFFIFIILIGTIANISLAENYRFETKEIKIINNDNKIIAIDGTAYSENNDIIIDAKKFEYLDDQELLKAFSGIAVVKSKNLRIKFNEIELNNKNFIITVNGDVRIVDTEKDLTMNSNLMTYNRNSGIIESPSKSIIQDNLKNVFETETFIYNLNNNILKIKNANFKDPENNNFYVELAYINTLSKKLFGKDIAIDLNNQSFNKENEPRLKGKSINFENRNSIIKKGIFTTCKKRDKCPPWQFSAEEIKHDKEKQTISYKNAWLKIYDKPIVYFPKFFHPDPTVKRKSGFLVPSLKSSKAENFLNIPYFYAISENRDTTFTPRFYVDDKILLQNEYRQENANSSHISDVSLFKEKDKDTKNHLFYNFKKKFNIFNFEDGFLNFKVEKTSNDTYLKANKLSSPIIENYDVLENSLNLGLSRDDLFIDTNFIAYESLTKDKSDRYEFILPKIDITKKIQNKTKLKGNFTVDSSNFIKNYETNILEKVNINNLKFNSDPQITKTGIYNNYDFIIKNVNTDSQNSNNYKQNENYYLSGLFQFSSSLPMIKNFDNKQNILKPKLTIKIAPNDTKNLRNDSNRLDVNNLFSVDRISSNDTLEGGVSIAYGNDFTILNKNESKEILSLKIANNVRFEQNNDLAINNQIGQKTSNIFTEFEYTPNSILTTKYNNSLKNNIEEISYENFSTTISLNNLITTFDYLNENNTSDQNSYLNNTTQYIINDSNNLSFSTRVNKKTDLTEYYNLMYQYKNDCLAASIEYNKDYYQDSDIKPEESVFFKLTLIPLGESTAPIKN